VVAQQHRRKGIATILINKLTDFLARQGCLAIYLAVRDDNPATALYKKLGFQQYHGIVMRRLLCSEDTFENVYYSPQADISIRAINWGDYAAVAALMVRPAKMWTFDFSKGVFSSRYAPPQRFLSVFPEMMQAFAGYGGCACVMLTHPNNAVVAIAHVIKSTALPQQHLAVLDCFVHDNYLYETQTLLKVTYEQSCCLSAEKTVCYIPQCDRIKRRAIEALGATRIAILPGYVLLDNKYQDVWLYELK